MGPSENPRSDPPRPPRIVRQGETIQFIEMTEPVPVVVRSSASPIAWGERMDWQAVAYHLGLVTLGAALTVLGVWATR